MDFLWFLIIGALAGFLSGFIMKGKGHGLVANLVIGIIGALLGGWLFGALGVSTGGGILGSLITATVGAIVFLFILRLVKKK